MPASFSNSATKALCAAITAAPIAAVCCDPPAMIAPGIVESPYPTSTRSIGSPSRSAATIAVVVEVPIPISAAATSTCARTASPSRVSVIRASAPGIL